MSLWSRPTSKRRSTPRISSAWRRPLVGRVTIPRSSMPSSVPRRPIAASTTDGERLVWRCNSRGSTISGATTRLHRVGSRGRRPCSDEDTECREYALLLMQSGVSMFGAGDLETAREHLARAGELARRTGDRDVEALARIYQGHVLVNLGEESAGMALADEATASAMSGELGVQAAGTIYCSTIVLCRNRGDWRRAQEWTDRVDALVPSRVGRWVPGTVPVPSRRDPALPRRPRSGRARRARSRRRAAGRGAAVRAMGSARARRDPPPAG